jgi:hypothetical protein
MSVTACFLNLFSLTSLFAATYRIDPMFPDAFYRPSTIGVEPLSKAMYDSTVHLEEPQSASKPHRGVRLAAGQSIKAISLLSKISHGIFLVVFDHAEVLIDCKGFV